MVGLFINTLPFRVSLSPDGHLTDLLRDVRALQIKLREHEHTPLAKVQSWSDVPRGRALFDSILVYDDRTLDSSLRAAGFKAIDCNFSYHGQTNYPLTAVAYGDDEILIRIENDRRHVDDTPAARMLGRLVTLVTAMPDYADQPLKALPPLEVDEREALAGGEGFWSSAFKALSPVELPYPRKVSVPAPFKSPLHAGRARRPSSRPSESASAIRCRPSTSRSRRPNRRAFCASATCPEGPAVGSCIRFRQLPDSSRQPGAVFAERRMQDSR